MPEQKKPSRKPASKPAARNDSSARPPATRRSRASREVEPDVREIEHEVFADDEPAVARPVAVGVAVPGGDAPEVPWTPSPFGAATDVPPVPDAPAVIERPRDELIAGVACAVLAITVFLPWYKRPFAGLSASGWSSGTWAPIVFFLALAGVAVVVLRLRKIPVSFPVDHALVLEGIGWLAVAGIVIKRFLPPRTPYGGYSASIGLFIALFAAVGVALLGGRVSSAAPMMIRPGWFADRAGKTGTGILAVALIAGLIFGVTNSTEPASPSGSRVTQVTPRMKNFKGFPPCGKEAGFPVPAGVTASKGSLFDGQPPQPKVCLMYFTSSLSVKTVLGRFRAAFLKQGWKVNVAANQYAAGSLAITGPKWCGTTSFIKEPPPSPGGKTRNVVDITSFISPCANKVVPGNPGG